MRDTNSCWQRYYAISCHLCNVDVNGADMKFGDIFFINIYILKSVFYNKNSKITLKIIFKREIKHVAYMS